MKHIINTNDFSIKFLIELYFKFLEFKNNKKSLDCLKGKLLTSIFFEPSTRTRLSFEAAMYKLGGKVLSLEDAKENSSGKKGETLEDSIKTASLYSDVLIVRHPYEEILKDIVESSDCPVINGGEGCKSHPTQSLIDYFTICENFGMFPSKKLSVFITGDLEKSRTIGGLVNLLENNNTCHFIYIYDGKTENINFNWKTSSCEIVSESVANNILHEADVLYMTRHQKERSDHKKSSFILSEDNIIKIKKDAIIMHPMPRGPELNKEIDNDVRARYWEQAKNGLYTRMALLYKLLN